MTHAIVQSKLLLRGSVNTSPYVGSGTTQPHLVRQACISTASRVRARMRQLAKSTLRVAGFAGSAARARFVDHSAAGVYAIGSRSSLVFRPLYQS